jgi:hypothetical protein
LCFFISKFDFWHFNKAGKSPINARNPNIPCRLRLPLYKTKESPPNGK